MLSLAHFLDHLAIKAERAVVGLSAAESVSGMCHLHDQDSYARHGRA